MPYILLYPFHPGHPRFRQSFKKRSPITLFIRRSNILLFSFIFRLVTFDF